MKAIIIKKTIRCLLVPIIVPIAIFGIMLDCVAVICNAVGEALSDWIDYVSEKL